jgi:hypothetical protein
MEPSALDGGYINEVVRVGDTVHRSMGPRSSFVHELLLDLDRRGFDGSPRYLGKDDDGREVLSFIPGDVPTGETPQFVRSAQSLVSVARLVREFHDMTAGTPLAGDEEVVCHNDLSPKNTVYRAMSEGPFEAVALIDWDIAAPGRRIHDVAHMCWQYLDLSEKWSNPDDAAVLIRLVAHSYHLVDSHDLIPTILWWQDRCWRGIEGRASVEPAMARLVALGVPRQIQRAHDWVELHAAALSSPLADPDGATSD